MALPTPEKTWQYDVNRALPSTGGAAADHRRWLRQLKTSLVGFASNPWLVGYSCDGTVAGTPGDGVDRWLTDGSLFFSSGPHSWIVLRQPAVATGFQLLLDLNLDTAGFGTVVFSVNAGFTGGTTLARPTATDEVVVCAGQLSGFSTSDVVDAILHVTQSADGQCTRAFLSRASANTCAWMLLVDRPRAPVGGWTFPAVCGWLGGTANGGDPTYVALNDTANLFAYQAGATPLYVSTEMRAGSAIGEDVAGYNDITGEWVLTAAGLVSETAGRRGRHGTLYDLWWTSTAQSVGDSFPADATRAILKIAGHLAIPWNGTNPRTHL